MPVRGSSISAWRLQVYLALIPAMLRYIREYSDSSIQLRSNSAFI